MIYVKKILHKKKQITIKLSVFEFIVEHDLDLKELKEAFHYY